MMKKVAITFTYLFLLGFLIPVNSFSATVNLNTWASESYPAVSGFGDGIWGVSGGGSTVQQSVNGQPTMFYSDFAAIGTKAVGKVKVTIDSDDDFIGFVLGFRPGDTVNATADYLLVDWKKGTQDFNFGSPSSSSGGFANMGLAVSRVKGIPDADEFWQHKNLSGTGTTNGLEELQRGKTLGSLGWVLDKEYNFEFIFTSTALKVYVDNSLELDITGTFNDGRLGFYNFSQAGVTYSSFTKDQLPPPVPVPSTLFLLGSGILGLAGVSRRKN